MLDTLTLLIEADARGMTATLNSAVKNIKDMVTVANNQQIDWKKILSSGISTSLIGLIASAFAIGLSQALQLQTALQQANLSSSTTTGSGTAAETQGVLNTSSQTGESAADVAAGLATISQGMKDTADSQGLLNAVSQEAYITNQSVADTANQMIPLFQQWGITTVPQAEQAMAALNQAVKEGNISFSDLVGALTTNGTAFSSIGQTIPQTAVSLELLSKQSGMTADSAVSAFDAIGNAVQNPISNLDALQGGVGSVAKAIQSGGLAGAFSSIATQIGNAGSAAQALFGGTGISPDAVTRLQEVAKAGVSEEFGKINTQAAGIVSSMPTLNQDFQDNLTVVKQLSIAWANIQNTLNSLVAPVALTAITDSLNGISGAFTELEAFSKNGFWSQMGNDFQLAFGSVSNFETFMQALAQNTEEFMKPLADVTNLLTGGFFKSIGDALGGGAYDIGSAIGTALNGGSSAPSNLPASDFSVGGSDSASGGQSAVNSGNTINYNQTVNGGGNPNTIAHQTINSPAFSFFTGGAGSGSSN